MQNAAAIPEASADQLSELKNLPESASSPPRSPLMHVLTKTNSGVVVETHEEPQPNKGPDSIKMALSPILSPGSQHKRGHSYLESQITVVDPRSPVAVHPGEIELDSFRLDQVEIHPGSPKHKAEREEGVLAVPASSSQASVDRGLTPSPSAERFRLLSQASYREPNDAPLKFRYPTDESAGDEADGAKVEQEKQPEQQQQQQRQQDEPQQVNGRQDLHDLVGHEKEVETEDDGETKGPVPLQGSSSFALKIEGHRKPLHVRAENKDDELVVQSLIRELGGTQNEPKQKQPLWSVLRRLSTLLNTYFQLHLVVFTSIGFLGALLIWGIEFDNTSIPFEDALFTSFSGLCVTGLTSTDFSKFRTSSQFVTFLLILFGGTVFESVWPLLIRSFKMKRLVQKLQDLSINGHKPLASYSSEQLFAKSSEFSGHMEYMSTGILARLALAYYVSLFIISFIIIIIYFSAEPGVMERNDLNPVWFSIFHIGSAVNNAGFALLPDNLYQLAKDPFFLFFSCFLIIMGNVGYPVFFRWFLSGYYRYLKWRDTDQKVLIIYQYIMRYPRRCFTHLFDSLQTKWLVIVISLTTLLQWVLYMIFEFTDIRSLLGLSTIEAIIAGIFQSISTRTAGFQVYDLGLVLPAANIVTLGFMYLSAYPFTVTLRKTNPNLEAYHEMSDKSEKRTVKGQAKAMLVYDITYVFVPWILISAIEGYKVRDDINYGAYRILFEIVSAYGTVGLSIGYPGIVTSFSTVFHPASKVIMCFVMLMGRHRGLPETIDNDVVLQLPIQNEATGRKSSVAIRVSQSVL